MQMRIAGGSQSVDIKTPIYVSITTDALCALREYVGHYKTEVSGCGMVTRKEHRDKDKALECIEYHIHEVFLPREQSNTTAATDIDEDVIHEIMTQLIKAGQNVEELKLHWHSHADMDVFHSSTDTDNYSELDNGQYLVSLVLNHAGEILASVHIYNELKVDITNVPLYVDVDVEMSDKMSKRVADDIKKLDKHVEDTPPVYKYKGKSVADTGYRWGGYTYQEEFERCDMSKCHMCDKVKACVEYFSQRRDYSY